MKITLLYDGHSTGHEASAPSAFSVLNTTYYNYYQVRLMLITKEGQWVKGSLLTEKPASKDVLHLSWDSGGRTGGGFTGKVINPGEVKEEGATVFPVLHGPDGEDGTIQGFLKTLNILCVGAGVLTSVYVVDEIVTKYILQTAGVPQIPYIPVLGNQWKESPREVFDQCEGFLLYPIFVRLANMGSSAGTTKAEDREELQNTLATAYQYDSRATVEQGVEAREIEIAVLEDEDARATLPGEIVKDVAFYDYETGYISNEVEIQTPAGVLEGIYQETQKCAKLAYMMSGGSGLNRCSFFLTSKNKLFLNKLNSVLGFTGFSTYPLLWESMGSKYGDLIEELIQSGMSRYHQC